jgi:uncharacterized membrane protein
MSIRTKLKTTLATLILGLVFISSSSAALITDSVYLYTPYTKIAVPPGQSIDYTIDFINNSARIRSADISVSGLPKNWKSDMKSGGYNVRQISVLPADRKTISLRVDVPFNVNKGTYRFVVQAGESESLPLTVIISEQGTFKTEFTTDQPNMQGQSNSTFTFNGNLKNSTAEKQTYALMANAPRGWTVTFKSNYQQVTSVSTEPNTTQSLTVEIKPSENAGAGKYRIPITAATSSTSANLDLEVVITGTFSMVLTTPTGLLSYDITAGDRKKIDLLINNTGSSELKDINLSSSAPSNWEVTFDPKSIKSLIPGNSTTVSAVIKADKKAIPGDYVTVIEAKTPEVSSSASLRMSVETPLLMGWIGIIVIMAALGTIYYLFRKYGRR